MKTIDQDSDTYESSVGEAFKLSQVDVDGYVGGGNYLFSHHPDGCLLEQRTQHNKKNYTMFNDRGDLMHAMAIDLGLTSAKELLDWSPSADYLSASNSGKSGYRMEMLFVGITRTIKAHCSNEKHLNQGLLTDFRTLPYPVQFPFLRSSWRAYEAFLDKWGTHLLRATRFGVKVVIFSFKTDTKAGHEAHFCSKMSEKGIHDLPICKSFTNIDYKDYKEHDDAAEEVYVYGGTPESKAQLQHTKGVMDSELIIRLSEEALTHEAPVKNTWQSVPHLLNTILMFSEEEGLKHRSIAFLEFYNDFYLVEHEYIGYSTAFLIAYYIYSVVVAYWIYLLGFLLLVIALSVNREAPPVSAPVVAQVAVTSSLSSSVPMVGDAVVARFIKKLFKRRFDVE